MKRFDLRQNPINGQFYMAESPTGEYVEYASLSHAAGQEAVAYRWMRNGEPVSEWRNGKPSEREVECARELIGHADWQPQFAYLTPAQPPASAEVGRDAAGKWELVPSGFLIDGPNGTAMVLDRAFIEPKIAALCENNGDDPEDYTATELYMKAWRGRAVDKPTMAASSGRNGGES